MSKISLPFHVGDISTFARTLRRQLHELERLPSHVEMLNLLVKAAGHRNFQHFRAQLEINNSPASPVSAPVEVESKLIKRLVRLFDEQQRLIRWPKKFTQRKLCLWVLWSAIPARETFTEKDISELLEARHLFGDHALLRRDLVDLGYMTRTADGSQYKRLERQPPAEAMELFKQLRNRE